MQQNRNKIQGSTWCSKTKSTKLGQEAGCKNKNQISEINPSTADYKNSDNNEANQTKSGTNKRRVLNLQGRDTGVVSWENRNDRGNKAQRQNVPTTRLREGRRIYKVYQEIMSNRWKQWMVIVNRGKAGAGEVTENRKPTKIKASKSVSQCFSFTYFMLSLHVLRCVLYVFVKIFCDIHVVKVVQMFSSFVFMCCLFASLSY